MRLALKWIKRLLITLCVICAIYSITWFAILQLISRELNKQYANKPLNTSIGTSGNYVIKFTKIKPSGFPFRISFEILNWSEERDVSKIDFNAPIHIGYDLLKQSIFASFSGDIIAKYKPLQSGFGAKIAITQHEISIKYPISTHLIKALIYNKDLFEIINFIKFLEFKSSKLQIFDLVDNTKLYDEDHLFFKLSINKHKYYTDLQDLLNNVPQQFDIIYATKILQGIPINRIIPKILLLPKAIWNFAFTINTNLYIKSNNSTLNDFTKDIEVGVASLESSSNIHSSFGTLLYKNKINDYTNNTYVKLASQITLTNNLDTKISSILKYLISGEVTAILGINSGLAPNIKDELQYIVDNPDKFNFKEFENRKYECELELDSNQKKDNLNTKINNFSILSGGAGIRLKNETDVMGLLNVNINGLILLNNYPAIIDIVSNYLYKLGKYKTLSDKSREVYKEALQSFVHSISDYPKSTSNDLSLEYVIDFSNLNKGKIGTVKINALKSIYHLALYKNALEKIQMKSASDNITTLILELVPTLTENPKLLEQLIISPTEIDKKAWEEIIK